MKPSSKYKSLLEKMLCCILAFCFEYIVISAADTTPSDTDTDLIVTPY